MFKMAESGHSQPTFVNGANRKKKRFPEFSRDVPYGTPRQEQTRRYSARDPVDEQDKSYSSLSQPNNKPPVILTKPSGGKSSQGNSAASTPEGETASTWQEVSSSPTNAIAPKLSMSFRKSPQPGSGDRKSTAAKVSESRFRNSASPYLVKQSLAQANTSSVVAPQQTESCKAKEVVSPRSSTKMLDGSLNWSDGGIEMLQEQTDFLVVGVLGMQGVGKSTVLSLLAGNQLGDAPKSLIFRPQTADVRERAGHMTSGIDMAVTSERLVLLDTQPILSPSLLEQHHERKNSSEYSGSVTIETQSLQIAAFLLTICHVVIVVQDWFTDSNIFKFLQVAEMLKPVTPPPAHDTSGGVKHSSSDLQPVIVFIHNKMESNMFNVRALSSMNEIMLNFVNFSDLHCKGQFSLSDTNLFPGLSLLISPDDEVNAFILPDINDTENEEEKSDVMKKSYDLSDQHFLSLPRYVGRPNTVLLENCFRKMMHSVYRHPITHQPLTEKNWFHYAARTWDALRKSQLVSEYNRLLFG